MTKMGRRVAVEQCKRGTDLPQSKLTEDDVRLMRALDDAGVPVTHIAAKFEVAYNCAWQVVRYATWRHV